MFAKVYSRYLSDILASLCQEYPSSGNTSMLYSADTRVGGFLFTFERLPNSGHGYVGIIRWNGPRQITSRPFQSPPLLSGQQKNWELHRFLVHQINYYYFCEVLITEGVRGGAVGTRWRSWLRHCATSRKVAGSVAEGVTGIFHWHNPSGRTMALGLTQPLTEMSTRNISWG